MAILRTRHGGLKPMSGQPVQMIGQALSENHPGDTATDVGPKYDDRMKGKQRLSASVDAELMQAGHEAVAEGRAESISAWVSDALRLKADHDGRMRALDEFIAAYEAEHGEITEEEMRAASRRARAGATVVRAPSVSDRPPSGRGQGTA